MTVPDSNFFPEGRVRDSSKGSQTTVPAATDNSFECEKWETDVELYGHEVGVKEAEAPGETQSPLHQG